MSSGGVTVMGADAPSNYHVAARSENPSQIGGSTTAATTSSVSVSLGGSSVGSGGVVKKKRGRPRKYGPDGSVSLALSPIPISSSPPVAAPVAPIQAAPVSQVQAAPVSQVQAAPVAVVPIQAAPVSEFSVEKRGRGRPIGSMNKPQPKVEVVENLASNWVSCSVGANFMPHVITVAAGEDVTMKIISFSQQGPRAICVLSANGVISNVTLRQPDSSGGTLTYEGRFEILSLSGSFMPSEIGGTRSRSGGMSVSLASPDGRVVGGGVAGLLVAATPVQVVVGSFLPCTQQEQKPKKPKPESTIPNAPTAAVPISSAEMEENYNGHGQRNPNAPKPNLTATASFRGENWARLQPHSMQESRNTTTDINVSLPEG